MKLEKISPAVAGGASVHLTSEQSDYTAAAHKGQSVSPSQYPDSPDHRGVSTSVEAADSVAPKLGRLQKLTLEAIRSRGALGLTADEAAEVLDLDRYSIQPRTSELRRKGQIIDSGKRRRNATGKAAIVWVAREHEQGFGDAEA